MQHTKQQYLCFSLLALVTIFPMSCSPQQSKSPRVESVKDATGPEPTELEQAKAELAEAEAEKWGVINDLIKDSNSPPVQSYLKEQKRRYDLQRENPNLKSYFDRPGYDDQLQRAKVDFDDRYGYTPYPGRLAFAKEIRLIQSIDAKTCLVSICDKTLMLEGIDATGTADGESIYLDKPLLIGPTVSYTSASGAKHSVYTVYPVDLEGTIGKQSTAP